MEYAAGTLGVEGADGVFIPIIHGDWAMPARRSCTFTTVADNQTRIEIHVLRGQNARVAEDETLGKFEFTDIAPAPKGVPQIDISLEADASGTISLSARDRATGRTEPWVVHPPLGGLSQADVQRLVEETRAQELQELARRKPDAVARQLDSLLENTARSLKALDARLSVEERGELRRAMDKAQRALDAGHESDDGGIDELLGSLRQMEKAASIIGKALLRPDPS